MSTWKENKEERLYLIQIDLANHSRWVDEINSNPDATAARAEFAERLIGNLKHNKFERVFWAGDGGVFCSPHINNTEDLISAIDEIFKTFEHWRSQSLNNRDIRSLLSIRVTVDLDNIYTHRDPGYWHSNRLNKFLKYEREIGRNGTAAITEEVFRQLKTEQQQRWEGGRTRVLLGVGEKWIVYRDQTRKVVSSQIFVDWLSDSNYSNPGDRSNGLQKLNPFTYCDETAIISKPLSEEGFGEIQLNEVDISQQEWIITENDIKVDKNRSFSKAALVRLVDPMTDDNVLNMQYGICPYYLASAFHRHVENNFNEWCKVVNGIKDFIDNEKVIPRILVTHNVVLFHNLDTNKKELLIGQRSPKEGQTFYYNGAWAVSFEEQFRPEDTEDGIKDETLNQCIQRGFKEEIAPNLSMGKPEIHAIFVESRNLNIAALGFLEFKGTAEELRVDMKRAKDYAETKIIIGVPFNDEYIEALLRSSNEVPRELLNGVTYYKGNQELIGSTPLVWHPTSKIRLALAKWKLSKE